MSAPKLSLQGLPRLEAVLDVDGAPQFAVVAYAAFVRLAAMAPAGAIPDVAAVLDAGGEHAHVVLRWDAYRRFLGRFEIIDSVDERDYLERYADVKAAVAAGQIESATRHYVVQGYFERRVARLR